MLLAFSMPAPVACGSEAPPDPRPWRERWAEFLHWSPSVPDLPHYREIRHALRSDLAADVFLKELRAHIDGMRENLAKALGVDAGCVSVKAKTGEGMDAVGRGEAVAAQAVVLLKKS